MRGAGRGRAIKKAFDAASSLPTDRQDAIAKLILAEIEDEKRWDEAFAGSQDKLADMAAEAITENNRGKTRPMKEIL